jgi:hypothetical protein
MSGSYNTLRTKYEQLSTYVNKNAVTRDGNNVFTGAVTFTEPLTIQDLEVIGQTSFTNTPHCNQFPILAQDFANRAYVDSVVGNSGNGFILYLNKSNSILGGYQLSNSVTTVSTAQTIVVAVHNHEVPIGTFISDIGFPALLTLPSGLWELNQWAFMSSDNGVVNLYFKVNIYNADGTFSSTIATSGYSSDVNGTSTNPDLYHLTATVPTTTLTTDKRLGIELFCISDINTTNRNLTCLFEDGNYSFVNTSIGLGTALLSQNNTWTGNNYFPTQPVGDSSKLVANTEFVALGIANAKANFLTTANTWTGDNFFVTQAIGNNSTKVATCAYADVQAGITANAIIAGNSTFTGINNFTTQPAGTNTQLGATCAFVNTAVATSNTNLLTTDNTWTGINLFTAGIPVGDSSGRVATTLFVDGTANILFNTIFSSDNDWTGSNTVPYPLLTDDSYKACPTNWVIDKLQSFATGSFTFGANTQGTTQATSDNSTKLATTAYVNNVSQSLLDSFLSTTNNWTGTNTAVTQPSTTDNTTIATTAFVQSEIVTKKTALLASNNSWTGTNTFTTQTVGDNSTNASTTAYAQATLTSIKNAFLSANTAWLGVNTAPTALSSATGQQIATLDFVKSISANAVSTFLGTPNTFTSINSFDTPATSNNGTRVATTAFCQSLQAQFLNQNNTFTGIQTFTYVAPQTETSNLVATTQWVNTYSQNYYTTNFATQPITFTGVNTCITPALSTNTTQMANCAFVNNTVSDYVTNTLPGITTTWNNMNVTTQPLGTSNTVCANTQFVQNTFQNSYNGLLTLANTWSATQNFVTQAVGNSTLAVATTQFVQTAFTNFLASANTFSALQTFNANIGVTYTPIASNTGSNTTLGYSASTATLPATVVLTTNVVRNLTSFIIPKGVWFVTINLQVNITTANASVTRNTYGLFTSATTVGDASAINLQSISIQTYNATLNTGNGYNYSLSFVQINSASQTVYFNTSWAFTSGTINATYTYSINRIA